MKPDVHIELRNVGGQPVGWWVTRSDPASPSLASVKWVPIQRGMQCDDCRHITLDTAPSGCCRFVVPVDVIACPNCDTLQPGDQAKAHLTWCYGGTA